jgi:hypothetical protein
MWAKVYMAAAGGFSQAADVPAEEVLHVGRLVLLGVGGPGRLVAVEDGPHLGRQGRPQDGAAGAHYPPDPEAGERLLGEALQLRPADDDLAIIADYGRGLYALYDGRYGDAAAHWEQCVEGMRGHRGGTPDDAPAGLPVALLAAGRKSVRTVESHVSSLLAKLGALARSGSREAVFAAFLDERWTTPLAR